MMSRTASGSTYAAGLLRRSAAPFALGFVMLFAQSGGHAQAADALNFFKNYFITGDYVVGGVGLRGTGVNGFATGTINMTNAAVPQGAEVLGAFLYWETVETTNLLGAGAKGAQFNDFDIEKI